MAESIAARVGRLVAGSANMIVDAVENMAPEVVMEQAIREVDSAIDDVRAELGRLLSKQHMATRRLADENRKHEDISEKIELALSNKRDDLAEAAIAQLLDIEAQIPILEMTIAETRDGQAELEGYISALQGRRREMKQELDQFREARAAASAGSAGDGGDPHEAPPSGTVATAVRKAEEAFNRALEGAGGIGSTASAPNRMDAAKRAELDNLARQNRIRERLESFKTKGQ